MINENKIYIEVFKAIVKKEKYEIVLNTELCINPYYEWKFTDYKEQRLGYKNILIMEMEHDIYKEFIEREYVASKEEISNIERHLYHYYLERCIIQNTTA